MLMQFLLSLLGLGKDWDEACDWFSGGGGAEKGGNLTVKAELDSDSAV